MVSRVLLAVTVVTVACAPVMAATVGDVFSEDFEGQTVGTFPTPNAAPAPYWVDALSGSPYATPVVKEASWGNATKFYGVDAHLEGLRYGANSAYVVAAAGDDHPAIMDVEFDLMGRENAGGRPVIISLVDQLDGGWATVGVHFDGTSITIRDVKGTNDLFVATWQEEVWQHVEMSVNTAARTVSVSVDGGTPVATTYTPEDLAGNHETPDAIQINGTAKYRYRYFVDNIQLTVLGDPSAPTTWNVDGSGDWNEHGNWDLQSPNANVSTAIFGAAITSDQTVYTNSPVTVKTIQFDNSNTYRIAGDTVNLEADSGNASVSVAQGDHEFQAQVGLNSSTDADIAAGASLTITNVLTLNGNTLTKTGDGTLSINNKLNAGGGSVVGLAGTISGDGAVGGDLTNTSATVAPGNSPGTLTVEGNFSQAAGGTLAIELAGTAAGEFDVLAVTGSASLGGSLDITELYTPGGADTWTILTAGGGITGAFDTITAGYQVALANGDTELILSLGGALLPGDANGDGCVDDLDLTALAVHWQQSTNLWENGDFNGDGIVDDLDLTALAVNWQQGCGGGGSFADAVAAANVPEPATLSLLALGGLATLSRRRR